MTPIDRRSDVVRAVAAMIAMACLTGVRLLSQASPEKPSFDVISIKPVAPTLTSAGTAPSSGPLQIVGVSIAATAAAQTAATPDLQDLLRRADQRRAEYAETFKDLTAVETRVTELFDERGQVEKRRTVVSDFLVYRSTLKGGDVQEYRIARAVDGEAVGNAVQDALKLFQRLAKAKTLEQEAERLQKANLKYALGYVRWGVTLNQFAGVREDRRADFEYAIEDREPVEGRDAIVLRYQLKAFRAQEARGIFRHFNDPRLGSRGRAWLDASDARLLRWENDITVVDKEISTPVTLVHDEVQYGPSAYGILTPTRIVVSFFDRTRKRKAPGEMTLAGRLTFTYSDFKKFEVTTDTDIQLPRTDR